MGLNNELFHLELLQKVNFEPWELQIGSERTEKHFGIFLSSDFWELDGFYNPRNSPADE